MVDRNLILRKLASLDEYRNQLREYEAITIEDYGNSWKAQRIVERTLQMLIEICIGIAGHVVADRNLGVPVSYADTFRILAEAGILTPDLGSSMSKMAKFRNLVVHDYERIDPEIVVGILRRNLDDFQAFRDAILTTIQDKLAKSRSSGRLRKKAAGKECKSRGVRRT